MKANLPNWLQHMREEPVSKETGIFCMSSMWPEKGCEGRALLPSLFPGRHGPFQLPCTVGVLVLIWRSRRWAKFISASPVNFRERSIPPKKATPAPIRRLKLQVAPNQEPTQGFARNKQQPNPP